MKDEKVIEKLDSILSDRFGFDDKKINKMKEHRFLSSEIGFLLQIFLSCFWKLKKNLEFHFPKKKY